MPNELKPCPECGEVPKISYACGEYFVMPKNYVARKNCFCMMGFTEMHASEDAEIEAWNRRVDNGTT